MRRRPNIIEILRYSAVQRWLRIVSRFIAIPAVVFLASHLSSEAPNPSGASSEYVDSAVCATCHPKIAKTFATTGMGRSAYRPTHENMKEDFERQNSLYHRPSERYYTMLQKDGKFYERRHQIGFDGKESNILEKQIDFVIGSGNHAHTYLHRNADGALTEMPVSWYAERGGYWAMSPGYDRSDQEEFRRAIPNDCVFCHNAYPLSKQTSPIQQDTATFGDSVQNGIGCQRCHGPGGSHVRAAMSGHATAETVRSAIVNPDRLPRDLQLDVCMQCHLETTSSPLPGSIRRYDRDPFSYRPGEPLGNYAIYFDKSEDSNRNDRFEIAHAAYRLRKSECFLRSQLTCTTCHNPHEASDGPEAVERYQAVCRSCHQSAHASEKQVGACTGCHMPKRRTDDAVHVVMTDHYIRKTQPQGLDLLAPLDEAAPESTKYQGPVKLYYPVSEGNSTEGRLYLSIAQVQDASNITAGVSELAQAIATYPSSRPEFYFELGKAYSKVGEKQKAIASLEQSLRRQPGFMKSERELVAELLANGDIARALAVIQNSLKIGKPDAILLTNQGNAYLHEDKNAAAEQSIRQALQLDPELPEANNLLGMALVRRSDKNAEKYFREAIRLQPEFPAAHNNLANLLAASGDYAQAGYHFEKAIASDPSYAEAHHSYGLLLEVARSYDRALTEFQQAVKLDPSFALAHSDLADLLAAGGKNPAAEEEYRLALRADPKLTEAMYGLANLLTAGGKPAEAEKQLRNALNQNPQLYEAHLLLGKLLATRGDKAEAQAHFQKAAQSPDPDVRQAAMKEIR